MVRRRMRTNKERLKGGIWNVEMRREFIEQYSFAANHKDDQN